MEEPAYRQHPSTYHQHDPNATKMKKPFQWSKLLLGAALLSILLFVIIDTLTTQHIAHGFEDFLEWIERNLVAGFFAFMGVYFVATIGERVVYFIFCELIIVPYFFLNFCAHDVITSLHIIAFMPGSVLTFGG